MRPWIFGLNLALKSQRYQNDLADRLGKTKFMTEIPDHRIGRQAPWQRLGGAFTMGLRSCTEADWLPFEDAFGDAARRRDQLTETNRLLDTKHNAVFAAMESSADACQEVLEMVTAHLARFHPREAGHSHREAGHSHREAGLWPEPVSGVGTLALETAARMVPEDLLLLAPRTRSTDPLLDWVLVGAALAFPAHWVLAEKMGRPLAGIHQPVPHYDERLEAPMDRFFTKMQIGPISQRWNWSLVTTDKLFTPHRTERQPLPEHAGINNIFLRMERQTLRKLPVSGHVLFTIRSYTVPVSAWEKIPGALEDLVQILAEMSLPMRAYKGVELYEAALNGYLASRASS